MPTTESPQTLMCKYAEILEKLNEQKVIRTYNSPIGDYAEYLAAKVFGLRLETNSRRGYDATDPASGMRYQIKSRWERGGVTAQSRELNVIRKYDAHEFDLLLAIIFDKDFSVKEAYIIEYGVIEQFATYREHVNGRVLILMGDVLTAEGVKNVTERFTHYKL